MRALRRQHYRKPVPIAFLWKRKSQFRQWTNKNEAKQQELSSRDILGCSSPPTPLTLLCNLLPACTFLATENHTAEVTGKLAGTSVAFGYRRQFPSLGKHRPLCSPFWAEAEVTVGEGRRGKQELSTAQQPLTTGCYFPLRPRNCYPTSANWGWQIRTLAWCFC